MRPAGRQGSVAISITPVRTSSDSLRISTAAPLAAVAAPEKTDRGSEETVRAEAGIIPAASDQRSERNRYLAVAIRQRIESRLGDRVHDLAIRITDNMIVLEGHCATFYTKQLAQHAALGVLEDEQLDNAIVVTM
jgi:hypothetical protein